MHSSGIWWWCRRGEAQKRGKGQGETGRKLGELALIVDFGGPVCAMDILRAGPSPPARRRLPNPHPRTATQTGGAASHSPCRLPRLSLFPAPPYPFFTCRISRLRFSTWRGVRTFFLSA